ncbi:hypothetical protein B0T13DRAFT_476701 [Neurospora crassa]|nr:hypothetical protein B0T13DRAFT_476701 [Neurospora crassa]
MQFLPTIMVALATSLVGALDSSDSSDDRHPVCKPKVPDFSQVPACAVPCIVGSADASRACSTIPPDYKCWCTPINFAAIIQAGTACTVASCGEDVANSAYHLYLPFRLIRSLLGVCGLDSDANENCFVTLVVAVALPAFQQFCCEVNARGIIW